MSKMISIRLSDEDYLALKVVSIPYGGMTNFITSKVREIATITPAEKFSNMKPVDVTDVVTEIKSDCAEKFKKMKLSGGLDKLAQKMNNGSVIVAHSPGCRCYICKPPK